MKLFAGSSSRGIDFLRPVHICDLTSEVGIRLLDSIDSNQPLPIWTIIRLYSSICCCCTSYSLLKEGRRNPAYCRRKHFQTYCIKSSLSTCCKVAMLSTAPYSTRCSIRGSCEAAVNATRSLLKDLGPSQHVIVKLDLKNAFSNVQRDHLIETCIRREHSVVLLNKLANSNPNIVLANGSPIESATGIQQGNPLGPLPFALVIDDTDRSVKSKLNV